MSARRIFVAGGVALVLALVLTPSPARAVIENPLPLEDVVKKQVQFIFMAKVDKIDPDKPSAVLVAGDALKGKAPFERLPINLTGDTYAKKNKHTPQLLKRLAPKLPVVVFVTKQDTLYLALVYTNGTWFQMTGEGDNPVWSFTHCEPYLRRTFKGTTAEMQQAVADIISGKGAAPKVDLMEKPGLGPEVEAEKPKEKPGAPSGAGGPPFAVIPTVAIGGIVSLLAMLFPAVFGGLTGQLKRWTAVISVTSLNTTLVYVHAWFAPQMAGSWWGTKAALWLALTVITALGVLWAWRRQIRGLTLDRDTKESASAILPSRYELILLLILSGSGVLLFAVCLLLKYPILALPWSFVLALWVGIWVGTLYVLLARLRANQPRARPSLSSEGMILWAMMPACLALGYAAAAGGAIRASGGTAGGDVRGGETGRTAKFLEATIPFAPAGEVSAIYARPLIDGDLVYTAVAYQASAFGTPGNVFCVERSTGKVVWDFNRANGARMKEVYSSPCLADGKLYVGEGLHSDVACKLYCLDAATGKKLWSYPTDSHTESSPCVVGGKVYCGAGGDGLLCLDAATGDKVWQYAGGHIDCPPVVVAGRVYCGSGVDRDVDGPQETAVFCLEADSGNEVWRVKTDLPAWGKPFLSGEQAFFPLGNGDTAKSVGPPAKPAGAVLCLSPKDGKQAWRFDVSDGVIEGPAGDREQVYFGSRDGHCYCVGRGDGLLRWKQHLGSPVIATPAVASCSCCGLTNSVYAIAAGDPEKKIAPRVCCLDPASGRVLWRYENFPDAVVISPPTVTVEHAPEGDRRAVYFGASLNGYAQAALYCLKDQWKEE